MRPPNAPPGLPHHPVPGARGTPGLYTNRHAVSYFTALLCGIPLSNPQAARSRDQRAHRHAWGLALGLKGDVGRVAQAGMPA